MQECVRKTKKTGREHGFIVCTENSELIPSGICEGEKKCVRLPKCNWPNTFMEFHTHPPGSMILPSTKDIYDAIAEDAEYICMGNLGPEEKGAIRCHRINQDDDAIKEFMKVYQEVNWEGKHDRYSEMMRILVGNMTGENNMMSQVREWSDFL